MTSVAKTVGTVMSRTTVEECSLSRRLPARIVPATEAPFTSATDSVPAMGGRPSAAV